MWRVMAMTPMAEDDWMTMRRAAPRRNGASTQLFKNAANSMNHGEASSGRGAKASPS